MVTSARITQKYFRPEVPQGSQAPQQAIVVRQASALEAMRVDLNVEAVINSIRSLKKTTFLDMIDPEYRGAVMVMATTAHYMRGLTVPMEIFVEDMALNWLAKKEIFAQLTQANGFSAVDSVRPGYQGALLALSINGSIVAVSEEAGGGERAILYGRINLRETSRILPFQKGRITGADRGCPLHVQTQRGFTTSPLIGLAVKASGDEAEMGRSVIQMTRNFDAVDGHTIWGRRK